MSSLVDTPEYQALARFIALTVEKRDLEARLRELKNTLRALQPPLLSYLAAANLRQVVLNGYSVHPQREPWIYPIEGVSRQQVCEALKIAGLGRMVRQDYSTGSLTAYVKQLEESAQLIVDLELDNEGKPSEDALRQLLHPALATIMQVKAAYTLQVKRKEDPYAKSNKRFAPDTEPEPEGDEDDD